MATTMAWLGLSPPLPPALLLDKRPTAGITPLRIQLPQPELSPQQQPFSLPRPKPFFTSKNYSQILTSLEPLGRQPGVQATTTMGRLGLIPWPTLHQRLQPHNNLPTAGSTPVWIQQPQTEQSPLQHLFISLRLRPHLRTLTTRSRTILLYCQLNAKMRTQSPALTKPSNLLAPPPLSRPRMLHQSTPTRPLHLSW